MIIIDNKLQINIHNRFDIQVTDSRDGSVKQEVTGYNTILPKMWDVLCSRQPYFASIWVGDTSNAVLIDRSATYVSNMSSKSLSFVKKKIILQPEELVGRIISNVGISGSNAKEFVTKAALTDANGNPITITKTEVDVITIYATVYITLNSTDGIDIIGMPYYNYLIRYLLSLDTILSENLIKRITVGVNDGKSIPEQSYGSNFAITSYEKYGTLIPDVPNKKIIIQPCRYPTTDANGNLTEILFSNIARMRLPNSSYCPPQLYQGVPIGTSDGVITDYKLPSKNIKNDILIVKVDGAAKTLDADYSIIDVADFNHINTCSKPNMASDNLGVKDPKNNKYYTIGQWKYFYCGRIVDNNVWLSDYYENVLPSNCNYNSGSGHSSCWFDVSPIDELIAISVGNTVGFLSTVDDIPAVTNKYTLDTPPPAPPKGIAFSPDGMHLAVSSRFNPVVIYKKDGFIWRKLPPVTGEPIQYADSFSYGRLSYSGDYLLAFSYSDTKGRGLTIYKRNGDTYILCSLDVQIKTGKYEYIGAFLFSKDQSNLLIAGTNDSVYRYSTVDGVNFKKESDILLTGKGYIYSIIDLDNDMIVYSHDSSPYHTIAKWDGKGKITNIKTPMITNSNYASSFRYTYMKVNNGKGLLVQTSDKAYIWDMVPRDKLIKFNTPPPAGATITADYAVNGIHKTDQYVLDIGYTIQFGEGV